MSSKLSTRLPQLPAETLRAKAAHLTIAGCLIGTGVFLLVSSWDEFTCTGDQITSMGPCGVGIDTAGGVFLVAVIVLVIGSIVLVRGLRRPVDADGAGGWRVGAGLAVIACGVLFALMVPTQSCPEGTRLSAVFRFCVSTSRAFQAPQTGLGWKLLASGVGLVVGLLVLFWRSMPWPLATAIVVLAFAALNVMIVARTTGMPGERKQITIVAEAAAALGRGP